MNKADNSCNGWTPLYWAARDGHETAVQVLVDAGAEVDNATSIGETPLYIAANNGHEAVLKALINAGADLNKAPHSGFFAGNTPLYMASSNGFKSSKMFFKAWC